MAGERKPCYDHEESRIKGIHHHHFQLLDAFNHSTHPHTEYIQNAKNKSDICKSSQEE